MSGIPDNAHGRGAVEDAASAGGAFLDRIGKADLETFTPEQWAAFIRSVCDGFCKGMYARASMYMQEDEIPF